jgi:hypothetical protein
MLPLDYIDVTKVMAPPFHLGTVVESPSKLKGITKILILVEDNFLNIKTSRFPSLKFKEPDYLNVRSTNIFL